MKNQTLDQIRKNLEGLFPHSIDENTAKIAITFTLFNDGETMTYAHAEICAKALFEDWFKPYIKAPTEYIRYAFGYDSGDLLNVKQYMMQNRKIDAIKQLRLCFEPKLGLKEAKEIVEKLCL
jgi:hypothetical protein